MLNLERERRMFERSHMEGSAPQIYFLLPSFVAFVPFLILGREDWSYANNTAGNGVDGVKDCGGKEKQTNEQAEKYFSRNKMLRFLYN